MRWDRILRQVFFLRHFLENDGLTGTLVYWCADTLCQYTDYKIGIRKVYEKGYVKREDFSHIKVQETVKVFVPCCMEMRQPVFLYGKNNDRGRCYNNAR